MNFEMREFWAFLRANDKLLAWIARAAVAMPIVAWLASIGPSWPSRGGVGIVTAAAQLVVMMMTFCTWHGLQEGELQHKVAKWGKTAGTCVLLYLVLSAFFSFYDPSAGIKAKGLFLKPNVREVRQPSESVKDLLHSAGYDAENVYQEWSVYLMRVVFIVTWVVLFCSVSATIAAFVLHQEARQQSE